MFVHVCAYEYWQAWMELFVVGLVLPPQLRHQLCALMHEY